MPVDPVRDAAIDVLLRVFEKGMYLDRSVDRTLRRRGAALSVRGKRFLTQLSYGTVRHRLLCDFILQKHLHQPLDKLPLPILVILRMGVFQSLFCHQVTFPAMVHTSVDLAKKRGHPGTARVVNAVLNRAPQTLDEVPLPDPAANRIKYLSVRYSLPKWMVRNWSETFGPEEAETIAVASNGQAPCTARVNTRILSRETLLANLEGLGHPVAAHPDIPEAFTFTDGHVPIRSKAFQEGLFFVQDPASMLAPHLLDATGGKSVLDLCAAPGGKATHLAALVNETTPVIAMDTHFGRMRSIVENYERLTLDNVSPITGDGTRPPFQPETFERVLVDAPCTGLGTLRRHPDLKWRVDPDAPERLAAEQCALLRSGLAVCKNGGVVVYSVCTFTQEETEEVIRQVLGDGNATLEDGPEWLNRWKISRGQYRILPKPDQLDGYFLTRLRKGS